MFKKILILIVVSVILTGSVYFGYKLTSNFFYQKNATLNQVKLLEKYEIENLSNKSIKPGKITIKDLIKENKDYNSYLFEFEFSPDLSQKTKKTTGQINLPKVVENSESKSNYPLILIFRGYIDQKTYKTGDGTRNVSASFAKNGFITISPDFLGYGGSDKEADNVFEARFQTYVTSLSLLKTLEQIKIEPNNISGLPNSDLSLITNYLSLFLWGHSNGGQILLTLLEESGAKYPSILWAPVSKPFPYSILYFTDDADDHGKFLRKELAGFENTYDAEKFSLTNYLDKIKAPILLQHGTNDESVPKVWSDILAKSLTKLEKDINYIVYPNADHNMQPLWNEAVTKDIEYFKSHM